MESTVENNFILKYYQNQQQIFCLFSFKIRKIFLDFLFFNIKKLFLPKEFLENVI